MDLDHPALDIQARGDVVYAAAGVHGVLILKFTGSEARYVSHLTPAGISIHRIRIIGQRGYFLGERAVLIVDLGDPLKPKILGSVTVGPEIQDMAADNTTLYLLVNGREILMFDISDPEHASDAGMLKLDSPMRAIAANISRFYTLSDEQAVTCYDASNRSQLTEIGQYPTGGSGAILHAASHGIYVGSEPNGITRLDCDHEHGMRWRSSYQKIGRPLAISHNGDNVVVLSDEGLVFFIDFSSPEVPAVTGGFRIPGDVGSLSQSGRTAYVTHGNRIESIDFSEIAPQLSNEALDFGQGVNYGGQRRAVIDNGILYVADWFSGVHLYDLKDPKNPALISSLHTKGSPKGIAIKDDTLFVADDDRGLQVIDVRDPWRPRLQTTLQTKGLAYAPQIDGNRLFLASHRSGFQIIDIQEKTKPSVLGEFDTAGKAWSIKLSGQLAWVADDNNGVLTFDVSDVRNPRLLGQTRIKGDAEEIYLDGDLAYVAAFDGGITILDIRDPGRPRSIGMIDTPGNARGLEKIDGLLYVADWLAGLLIYDVTTPARPRLLGHFDSDGAAWGVVIHDHYAYLLDWWGGLAVLDISNPKRPALINRYLGDEVITAVATLGQYAFVGSGDKGMQVYDIKNRLNPTWVGGLELGGTGPIEIADAHAYVGHGDSQIAVIDVTDPFTPILVQDMTTEIPAKQLRIYNRLLWVGGEGKGIAAYTIDQEGTLSPAATDPDASYIDFTPLPGHGLLISRGSGGLEVWRIQRDRLEFDKQILSNSPAADRVCVIDGSILLHHHLSGISINRLSGLALRRYGFVPVGAEVDQMACREGTLYAATSDRVLYEIDVSEEGKWRYRTRYRLLGTVGSIHVLGDTIYIGGNHDLIALRRLPEVPLATSSGGSVSGLLPAGMPLGSYHLSAFPPKNTVLPPEIIGVNALQVRLPEFGRPRFTLDGLKRILEQ